MEESKVDFRWGIPALDSGFTTIPNFVIRRYSQLGVTYAEFAFVMHLASYKFDSPKGQASPSLQTIAAQMGLKIRQMQYIRASLEKKGYLQVTERPGQTSVYDFQKLALACLELETTPVTSDTPATHCTPPLQPTAPLPMQPIAPKEQEEKNKKQQQQAVAAAYSQSIGEKSADAVAADPDAVASSSRSVGEESRELEGLGISEAMAVQLVEEHGSVRVRSVLDLLRQSSVTIRHPSGWVLAALRDGYTPSKPSPTSTDTPLLKTQRGSCTFRRNPVLGECPSEEYGEPAYPWCRGCERGG